MAPEMRDNDVPIVHLLSQTVNWHLRPDSFYIVFFAKISYLDSYYKSYTVLKKGLVLIT